MVNFDDVSKNGYSLLGFFKIRVFWSKDYDVIVSVHVFTKILSRDSNYTVDVIMWPNFGNFNISMR